MTPKPITREDMYYSYLINGTGSIPKPITRKEQYLYYLCANGFGNGGGTVTPEAIDDAVERYLTENPIDSVNFGNLPEATEITETDKLLLGQDAQNKSIEMSGLMDFMRENGLFDLDGKGRPLLPGYGIVTVSKNITFSNGDGTAGIFSEVFPDLSIKELTLITAFQEGNIQSAIDCCYIDQNTNEIMLINRGKLNGTFPLKLIAIYKLPAPYEPGLKTITIRKKVTISNHIGVACPLSEFGIADPSIIVSMSAISYSFDDITNVYAFLSNQNVMIYYPGNTNTYVDQDIEITLLTKDYSSIGPAIVTEGIRVITRKVSFTTYGESVTMILRESDLDVAFEDIIAVDFKSDSLDGYTGYAVLNVPEKKIELITRANTGNGQTFSGVLSYIVKVPVVEPGSRL